MLFFILGASGSGKTAALPGLRAALGEIRWHDFDENGVPNGDCPACWRPIRTEYWLSVAHANQRSQVDTGVAGGAVPGEILACPSAEQLEAIRMLLLDCQDVQRIARLRERGGLQACQSILNWAAWLRMHASDPEWEPRIIRTAETWTELRWANWDGWKQGDQRWRIDVLDTTHLSTEEVVANIVDWVVEKRLLYRLNESAKSADM